MPPVGFKTTISVVERPQAARLLRSIDQNYFQFPDGTYIQTEGPNMGASTSSIFSENTEIYNLFF
jgi:hypothetical protein